MTYIELVVTACLLANPLACDEHRLPTGFPTVAECEAGGMLLAAGMLLDEPTLRATKFACEEMAVERET